jgi:hypothetical protein
MRTYRAIMRGSLKLDDVLVPFEKGMNVSAIAEQTTGDVVRGLVRQGVWEDVTVEIREAEAKMDEQLKRVEKSRKSKTKK